MKKNTKGFTLIELLAVIVILAIIALIATPIVLNLINKAREGAAKDSAYGVRKAAQLYYQTALIDTPEAGFSSKVVTFGNGTVDVTDAALSTYTSVAYSTLATSGFEVDGTAPKAGWISISKAGKIAGCVQINSYYCGIGNSGEIKCSSNATTGVTAQGTAPACNETAAATAAAPAA